jgi:hypothetical protein
MKDEALRITANMGDGDGAIRAGRQSGGKAADCLCGSRPPRWPTCHPHWKAPCQELKGPSSDGDHSLELFGGAVGKDLNPAVALILFSFMPNDAHHQLTDPPELTGEEVRQLAYRSITECRETKAKAYDLIAKSHDLLRRMDELLAR